MAQHAIRLDGGRESVVAFVEDESTARALEAGLAALGSALHVRLGDVTTCTKVYADSDPPQVLIVDIGRIQDPRQALNSLASVCPTDTKAIVIGENRDIAFYHMLVRELGVAEYLAKPLSVDTVRRVLLPQLTSRADVLADAGKGEMITVCGARAGVGARTVAINLAYALKDSAGATVGLVDLDLRAGEIASLLGVNPSRVLRAVLRDGGTIDTLLLERVAIELEPALTLFAPPLDWDSGVIAREDAVRRLADALRQNFAYTVVLLPMPIPPNMEYIVAASRHIVTVLMPDTASLRDTFNVRDNVAAITGSDHMLKVVNRFNILGGLDKALVGEQLGEQSMVRIPDLGNVMLEAVNQGIPAIRHAPAIAKYFAPLVQEITGIETRPHSGLWGGFSLHPKAQADSGGFSFGGLWRRGA